MTTETKHMPSEREIEAAADALWNVFSPGVRKTVCDSHAYKDAARAALTAAALPVQVLTEEDYREIGERCILDGVITSRLHDETRAKMKTAIAKDVGQAVIDRFTNKTLINN